MRILVTGSSGFIGRRLVDTLTEKGHDLFAWDKEIVTGSDWPSRLELDLNRSNPEAIFHVGACSNTLEQNVQSIMIQNFECTKVLADWARSRNASFIYSSSAANYGTNGSFPSNLYGWSKYAGEQYVVLSQGIALRYFNVYGPGEDHKNVMSSFFLQAHKTFLSNNTPKLFPGKPQRDFVYVEDVLSANFFALESYEALKGRCFDVGTCTPRTFEDGLEIMGIPFGYHDESSIPDGYQFHTSASPLRLMPGWKPVFTLESGLKSYLSSLVAQS